MSCDFQDIAKCHFVFNCSRFFQKKDVYLWTSQSSTAMLKSLRIRIRLNQFSKSWVDIIISQLNVERMIKSYPKEHVSLPFILHEHKNIGYHSENFILLKINEKLKKSSRLKLNMKIESCFDGARVRGKLSWSSGFTISQLRDFKLISLRGRVYEGMLEMSNRVENENTTLKRNSLHLIWLREQFEDSHLVIHRN